MYNCLVSYRSLQVGVTLVVNKPRLSTPLLLEICSLLETISD